MVNTQMRGLNAMGLLAAIAAATASAPAVAQDAAANAPSPAPVLRLLAGDGALSASAQPAVLRIGVWDGSIPAQEDFDDPVTCLTEAIYYEARSESLVGQEAVAQVVINRTHRPAFPGSICGVIFQRTGDTSGCQFSFVCDGSMDKSIEAAAWTRARAVAQRALGGFVYKPLRNAVHYHAAWMTPYWSASFARIGQIGGHIFYQ